MENIEKGTVSSCCGKEILGGEKSYICAACEKPCEPILPKCEYCQGTGKILHESGPTPSGDIDQWEQVCECQGDGELADMSGADGEGNR